MNVFISSSICCRKFAQVIVWCSPSGERPRYYIVDRLRVCGCGAIHCSTWIIMSEQINFAIVMSCVWQGGRRESNSILYSLWLLYHLFCRVPADHIPLSLMPMLTLQPLCMIWNLSATSFVVGFNFLHCFSFWLLSKSLLLKTNFPLGI